MPEVKKYWHINVTCMVCQKLLHVAPILESNRNQHTWRHLVNRIAEQSFQMVIQMREAEGKLPDSNYVVLDKPLCSWGRLNSTRVNFLSSHLYAAGGEAQVPTLGTALCYSCGREFTIHNHVPCHPFLSTMDSGVSFTREEFPDADFTLITKDGVALHVYRAILKVASPVFSGKSPMEHGREYILISRKACYLYRKLRHISNPNLLAQ
jgi:hypothetical protein